jgi:hypothetical protein
VNIELSKDQIMALLARLGERYDWQGWPTKEKEHVDTAVLALNQALNAEETVPVPHMTQEELSAVFSALFGLDSRIKALIMSCNELLLMDTIGELAKTQETARSAQRKIEAALRDMEANQSGA